MKIARIIARLNVGGPARHVTWLTRELAPPEFESTLIAGTVPPGEDDMAYFAADNGIEPILIPELSRELSPKDVVSLLKIYRELKHIQPDIVHTHTAKAGTIGRIAAMMYRWLTWQALIGRPRPLKTVHTFHGHVFHSYYGALKTRIFLLIEQILAKTATDKIIVISHQQFDEIWHTFRIGSRRQFEIIPLGLDLEPYSIDDPLANSLRSVLGIDDETLIVGFTGRLTEIKNIPMLLAAISEITGREDGDIPKMKFVIVGDGSLRDDLIHHADELQISEFVTFLGHRGDIPEIVKQFDIFVLTSKNEGTPLSMIEAMAAGIPVVSTCVGGVADLIGPATLDNDGFRVCQRGIAVDTFEPDDLANALIHLANSPQLSENLSSAARTFVNSNYSIDRLVENIRSLYRDLVDERAK